MGIVASCCPCLLPKSDENTVIVPPQGLVFCPGLASDYDEDSYKANKPYIKNRVAERDYRRVIRDINESNYSYTPCPTMWCCGYFLAIPTAGLSLLLLYCCCVSEAERHMQSYISKWNNNH